MLRQTRSFAAVGLEIGLALIIGIFGGRWLDQRFDTAPILSWAGLLLGIGAAVKAFYDAAKRLRRAMHDGSDEPGPR